MEKKKNRLLKGLRGLILGGLIGFAVYYLTIWIAGGDSKISSDAVNTAEQAKDSLDILALIFSIICAFVSLFLSVLIHVILHEAGHLVFGKLSGYKFSSFRILSFMFTKDEDSGKLKLKRYSVPGTIGQCILIPPEVEDASKVPYFWYNIGGVLVNIILCIGAIMILRHGEHGVFGISFFMMMIVVGIFFILMNGLPIKGASNDGSNIIQLHKSPEDRVFFYYMMLIAGGFSQGKRPSELPKEWFPDIPVEQKLNPFSISQRSAFMGYLEDKKEYDKARGVAEEILSVKDLPKIFLMEIGAENVMLEILTSNRPEIVKGLWTEDLQKYCESSYKHSSVKCDVLYAYFRHYGDDQTKADFYKDYLLSHLDSYAFKGEALTAKNILDDLSK